MSINELESIDSSLSAPPDAVFSATGEFLHSLEHDPERPAVSDLTVTSGQLIYFSELSSRALAELFSLCLGVTRPSADSLYLFGDDLGKTSRRKSRVARRRIGVCGGPLILDNDLTVRENLALPCQLKGLSKKQVESRVERITENIQLENLLHLKSSRLGFLERRLVAVARALVHDPELALLEAPLAGIDQAHRESVSSFIERLAVTGAAVIVFNDTNPNGVDVPADGAIENSSSDEREAYPNEKGDG